MQDESDTKGDAIVVVKSEKLLLLHAQESLEFASAAGNRAPN